MCGCEDPLVMLQTAAKYVIIGKLLMTEEVGEQKMSGSVKGYDSVAITVFGPISV